MVIQKLVSLFLAIFSFIVVGSVEEKPIELNKVEISKQRYEQFYELAQTRLPQWQKLFKKYAQQYDIPWTLIAAVAYQESKWDVDARSHTGVRGLMQLTSSTAEYLGIEDRKDPHQSIKGGAYYLKYLFAKTPSHLSNYERWTQALAAYNIGWAHLRDARNLAADLDLNPYIWKDLKKVLPLLEQEETFSELKFGYARGRETVRFVDNVLAYYKILNQSFTQPLLTSRDF